MEKTRFAVAKQPHKERPGRLGGKPRPEKGEPLGRSVGIRSVNSGAGPFSRFWNPLFRKRGPDIGQIDVADQFDVAQPCRQHKTEPSVGHFLVVGHRFENGLRVKLGRRER